LHACIHVYQRVKKIECTAKGALHLVKRAVCHIIWDSPMGWSTSRGTPLCIYTIESKKPPYVLCRMSTTFCQTMSTTLCLTRHVVCLQRPVNSASHIACHAYVHVSKRVKITSHSVCQISYFLSNEPSILSQESKKNTVLVGPKAAFCPTTTVFFPTSPVF